MLGQILTGTRGEGVLGIGFAGLATVFWGVPAEEAAIARANVERASIAATTLRVCHSSVASPQPISPGWSVTTFTNTQFRIRAWQTNVSIFLIFIRLLEPQMDTDETQMQRGKDLSGWQEGQPQRWFFRPA